MWIIALIATAGIWACFNGLDRLVRVVAIQAVRQNEILAELRLISKPLTKPGEAADLIDQAVKIMHQRNGAI